MLLPSLATTPRHYGCIKFVIDVCSLFEDEIVLRKLGHLRFDMEVRQMNDQYCSYEQITTKYVTIFTYNIIGIKI